MSVPDHCKPAILGLVVYYQAVTTETLVYNESAQSKGFLQFYVD